MQVAACLSRVAPVPESVGGDGATAEPLFKAHSRAMKTATEKEDAQMVLAESEFRKRLLELDDAGGARRLAEGASALEDIKGLRDRVKVLLGGM